MQKASGVSHERKKICDGVWGGSTNTILFR